MALLQAILTALSRSAGKLLNMVFSWATVMLFGKVPAERQTYLSGIGFASVLWLVCVLGEFSPKVGVFLFSFVTIPDWATGWARLGMTIGIALLPLVVGVLSILILDPADRPKTAGEKAKAVFKGFPFTIGLALSLVVMLLIAPAMKIRDLVRRWQTAHVPVMIEAESYEGVLRDLAAALKKGGYEVTRHPAPRSFSLPTKMLTLLTGSAMKKLVADRMAALIEPGRLEVLLHPSDIVLRGPNDDVCRAHATIAEYLTFTEAYLTWTKEANELEDRLRELWLSLARDEVAHGPLRVALDAVERDMRKAKLPYEEWEVLFREKLVVERRLLMRMAGVGETGVRKAA